MATPEEALLDCFYLGMTKTRLFAVLPELDLPADFDFGTCRGVADKIASDHVKSAILKRQNSLQQGKLSALSRSLTLRNGGYRTASKLRIC